jgi:hypothetical protein
VKREFVARLAVANVLFAQNQPLHAIGASLGSSTPFGTGSLSPKAAPVVDSSATAPQLVPSQALSGNIAPRVSPSHAALDLFFATDDAPAALGLYSPAAFLS